MGDDMGGDMGGDMGDDMGGDTGGDDTMAASTSMEASADAMAGSRWPRAVIARPLTLPKSLAAIGLDLAADKSFDVVLGNIRAQYGIDDKLEAGIAYGFALKEFEAKGSLNANVGYALARGAAGGKLEVIGRGSVGYNFLTEGLNPLTAGLQAQYNISDKLAVVMPGNHLSIGLEEPNSITFGLPVGVGYQITPEFYAQLDTQLANIAIKDAGDTAIIFADTTPLAITATYNAMPALDVYVGLSMDLTPADPLGVGDTLAFLAGATYYAGDL
ncbi:MAG: hypothetical protein R2939_04020 [Kofleriaceae bacterium]